MKKFLNDLEKITSINTQLQNKLGEITIWISKPENLLTIANSDTKPIILVLQNFLCHKYYLDFMKLKINEKENSIYDNCMNLILIVLAKLCKISTINGEIMIKYFIYHINNHLDCFNHIISFYRLYITSPQLKQCGKKDELYNCLFQLYKRLYLLNYEYEPKNGIKDINTIFKSGIIKQISGYNNLQDQKYLTEYYLQLTERPINKILNNENYGNNMSDNYNMNSNFVGENFFNKDLKFINNNHSNKMSNLNKNSLSHIINSYSKTNILSRTDRKVSSNSNLNTNIYNNNANNNQQISDLNNFSSKINNDGINLNNNIILNKNINIGNINQKEIQNNNKNMKPKIPTLKFPLDKTQPQQKFSLIRSSHRNDFSKSGDGSSTTTTKNKIFTNKLAEGSSINRHFAQDVLILEPKEKLKELAFQLGENYLATDFTSLINQKRDYELEKYKRKNNNKKEKKENNEDNTSNILSKYNNGKSKNYSKRNNIPNSECQSSNKLNNYIEKINSVNENRTSDDKNLSMNLNMKNLTNKNDDFSIPDSKQSFKNKNNNNISEKSNYSISTLSNNYQNSKNFIKVREILTNFIISFLKEYTEDEFKYLKIDIYTIFSYLSLPSMENLQNKLEKKRLEIIEQMIFILDKEKDAISYGNFLYLPDKIEIYKKKFLLNSTYNGNISYKNMMTRNNYLTKEENSTSGNNNINKERKNKTDENYNIFESLLSITFEEDNNCPLVLKNENEALYDILSMYSCNIETELKKILLYKNFYPNLDLSVNGIKFVEYNSINFDTLMNHLDPFMELIINRLNLILLSTEPYNCYSNNINNQKINSMNLNELNNANDDYIMKLIKNYFDMIHYYINTSKNRLLKIYTLKSLKNILPLTKNIFIIIFNRLTNLNYTSGNNSNSNYNNNNYKNSSMSLENNFTERYDFRVPNLLIDAFCSFIRLLSSFINCFDYSNNVNLSRFLNDNFLSNTDWLNVIKFLFDYLFLSNLNKEYTIKINNNNINKTQKSKLELNSSNSQRIGNIFFNKCSVCSILKDDNISMFNDNLSEIYKSRVKQLIPLIQFFYESNVYFQKIISINISNNNSNNNNQNITENNISPIINSINDADYINNKKYWSNSLNNYLLYLNMLLNSKSGSIFDFFICSNGGNFLFSKIKLSIIFTHYNLTKNLLILQESTLNFPMKYSFIMNEMTSLDVIRLHYIAFIKLYNKNIIFNTNLSEVSSIIATSENFQQKKTIKAFVKDIHNDQNLLNILLNLCKMHLRCLFVISKNRNADVTNKFFQLKIVDYFTHEIQLEHEVAEKVYKLNQFNNNQSKKDIKLNLNLDKNKKTNIKKSKEENNINLNINNKKEKEKEKNINENKNKNKNVMKKLDFGKLNLGEKIEEKINLQNINENSLEDKENQSTKKKNKKEDYGLDEFSLGGNGDSEGEEEELNENEENEELEEDFDEIPLVAPNNNACSYNNKIPKLNMLSSSFSDNQNEKEEDDNNEDDNVEEENDIEENEEENNDEIKEEKKEEKKDDNDNNNINKDNGPKIKLNLNLALCKTKSDKNKILQEEINKIDKHANDNKTNEAKKENNNNDMSENKTNNKDNKDNDEKKEGPKIQLKLNLDLCKTKSNKNELLKNEILKISNKPKEEKETSNIISNNSPKEIKPNLNIKNDITNKISQENNSNIKINNNQNIKKIIQLPKLNLKISKLKPKENKFISNLKSQNIKKDTSNSNHISQNNSNDNENIKESNNIKNLNKDPSIASKIRVEIENHLKEKYKLFYQKAINEGFTENDLVNVNQFYLKERNNRVLYQDPEIQVLIIALLFSLIITPSRGTLEELYCSVFPYENNKLNILYIIHHHLNREENYHILPLLLKFVSQIHPFGAGQRLLKLTCKHFFNSSIYNNWEKIGGGQFGTVFQCTTGLTEPNIVAIKKTELEQNIFSPCHLFDIFTEVTALEALRLENCVTQLYDYGCDDEYYYIVMKRYPISLKKWRIQQKQPLKEMLPTYLSIFKDVLHAVQIIHNNKITHYDLKCDNIVLDFVSNFKENNTYDVDVTDENENYSICIIVADFGECRMFLNEVDEHCTRSRGTDVIKSPEMLKHFGYQIRKEDDNYDRRKKVGTTRSSDIWSLGCLFYELLTGNFLFEEIQDNYLEFMYKIDKSSISELLTEKKLSLIDNNPYLVDFLKFMLVKNQTYRPNIDTVIKRFEHVYALLEGGTGAMIQKRDFDMLQYDNKIYNESYFENSIENCEDMINNEDNEWDNTYNKDLLFNNIKLIPEILKLTNDIYIAQYDFVEPQNFYYSNINSNSNISHNNSNNVENNLIINTDTNNANGNSINKTILLNHNNNQITNKEDSINILLSLGITHIITFTSCHKKTLKNKFLLFNLNENVNYQNLVFNNNMNNPDKKMSNRTPFEYIFKTMDFLRECMIHKGKVLFVDDYFYNNIPYKPNCLIRSLLLIIFAHFLNQSAYDTYTYLNNKLLFYNLPMKYYLPSISNWIMNQNIIFNYLSIFPIFRCFCGACQLIMRRDFIIKRKTICNCQKNDSSVRESDCPSNGCTEYIEFIKKIYNKNYNSLIWGTINLNNFYVKLDSTEEKHYKQIITFSNNLENNILENSCTEKIGGKGGLTESSMRKKTWKLYKCKICYCWIFGQCNDEIQVLLNNEYNLIKNIENRKKLIKDNELKDISLEQLI